MVLQLAAPTLDYNDTSLIVSWMSNSEETLDIIKYLVQVHMMYEDGTPATPIDPIEVSTAGISSSYNIQIERYLVAGHRFNCDVTAYSVDDNSIASPVSNTVVIGAAQATVPDFPRNIVAVAGPASATITWDTPVSVGEPEVIDYTVISIPDNKTQTVPVGTNTCTITGLKNGTSYKFQVFARNVNGISGTSAEITALE